MVIIVWETWLNSGDEAEGLRLTRQIWADMQYADGYISHQLLVDQDTPTHLLLISRWRSRAAADRSKRDYTSDALRTLKRLLARERGRWVYSEDEHFGDEAAVKTV
jgi:quinol monooxygenase YgiN